jgi:hypothetical protein
MGVFMMPKEDKEESMGKFFGTLPQAKEILEQTGEIGKVSSKGYADDANATLGWFTDVNFKGEQIPGFQSYANPSKPPCLAEFYMSQGNDVAGFTYELIAPIVGFKHGWNQVGDEDIVRKTYEKMEKREGNAAARIQNYMANHMQEEIYEVTKTGNKTTVKMLPAYLQFASNIKI